MLNEYQTNIYIFKHNLLILSIYTKEEGRNIQDRLIFYINKINNIYLRYLKYIKNIKG